MINNVVIFIPAIEKGGVERNAIWAANEFTKSGLQVDVVYVRMEEEQKDKFISDVHLVQFTKKRIPGLNQRIADAVSIRRAFDKYLKTKRKENTVVLAFQSASVAVSICRKNHIRVICRLSNHPSAVKYEKSNVRKLSEWIKPHTYKKADVIIANSKKLAEDFSKMVGREVLTVYNPIDFEMVKRKQIEPVEPWITEEAANFKGRLIIAVGRLTEQKDPETMIRGFAASKTAKTAMLWILGEGNKRQEIEKLIQELNIGEHVRLFGYQKNVYKYLKYADLYIQTSLYEGCPNSLIEAIATGIPAIATDCLSGPSEVLLDGAGGDLIPLKDAKILAERIDAYFEQPKILKEKLKIAQASLGKFEKDSVISTYMTIFKNLCGET